MNSSGASLALQFFSNYVCVLPRFETNDELYNLYRYHGETRTSVPGHCNETCRANHLCDIRTIAYDARQTCEVPEDDNDGFFHF